MCSQKLAAQFTFFLVLIFGPAGCCQEVYEINGADVVIFPDHAPTVLASKTGFVEYTKRSGETEIIKTQSYSEIESDMPQEIQGLSKQSRRDWRLSQYADTIAGIRTTSPDQFIATETIPLLSRIAAVKTGRETLGMTEQDFVKLNEQLEDYRERVRKIFDHFSETPEPMRGDFINRDLDKLNQEVSTKVKELLNAEQLKQLAEWSPYRSGLFKLLTETPVGEMMGFDEKTKSEIRHETDEIMEELKSKIDETRKRLDQVLEKRVNENNRSSFETTFGPVIENQLYESSIQNLIRMADYSDEELSGTNKRAK